MAHDILIVDDEDDIRQLIAGILDDEGFNTRQAATSAEAFAAIAARQPALSFWMSGCAKANMTDCRCWRLSAGKTRRSR